MILIMVSRLFRIPDLFLKSTCPVFTPPYILQRIIPPTPSRSFLFSRECNPYCKLILKRCRFYALPGSWTVLKEFRSKKIENALDTKASPPVIAVRRIRRRVFGPAHQRQLLIRLRAVSSSDLNARQILL